VSTERDVDPLMAEVVKLQLLSAGDVVVFINVSPEQDRADGNFVHVRRVSAVI
jgi:hypothetical protein